jgi:hypothetical protein
LSCFRGALVGDGAGFEISCHPKSGLNLEHDCNFYFFVKDEKVDKKREIEILAGGVYYEKECSFAV